MAFLFSFKRQQKSVPEPIFNKPQLFGFDTVGGTTNVATLKMNGYGNNPYVYTVISRIAQTISRFDYELKNGDKDITNGIYFDLLQEPNSEQYFSEFTEGAIIELLTSGEIFIVLSKPIGFRAVKDMRVLKSQFVDLIVNAHNEVLRYEYTNNNKVEIYQKEDILHIKMYNPLYNDSKALRGLSPLFILQQVTNASNSNFKAEASILENRGFSGFISGTSDNLPITKDDKEMLQKAHDKRFNGSDKFGKVAVVSSPVNYVQVGASSTDLQLLDSNVAKLRVICSAFNLGSQLFGDTASSTFANMEQATRSAYTECYIPLATFFISQLNRWFKSEMKIKEQLELNTAKIEAINTIDKALSDKLVNEVKTGIISAEQAFYILYPDMIFDTNAKPQTNGSNIQGA